MERQFAEERLLAEVAALEPLSEDPSERLDQLHLIAAAEGIIMDNCPECGISLEGIDIAAHSLMHWPPYLERRLMSAEAKTRQLAMSRAASKQKLPRVHAEDEE